MEGILLSMIISKMNHGGHMSSGQINRIRTMKKLLVLFLTPIIATTGFHVYLDILLETNHQGGETLLFLMSLAYGVFCMVSLIVIYHGFVAEQQ